MIVLLLLDGWGIAPTNEANAIAAAKTPVFFSLIKEYPVALLATGSKSLNARYLTLGTGREIAEENIESAINLTAAIATANLRQLKIAETERFAALTYFFNGQANNKYSGEDWKIISSETGDHTIKKSLALRRTVKEIVKAINVEQPADFIAAAIPYLDLTAASGDFTNIKKAVELLDKNLGNIAAAIEARDGILIISAACGNAERMRNMAVDLADTDITENPVPLVIVGREFKGRTIGLIDPLSNDLSLLSPAGTLADLAPTILQIMGLSQPPEMTGRSLLDKN
jgi:2,3-bisphosphoglycerate-independent phosphoglycerate mutase